MLASTPTTRPLALPGTQNIRQRRGIHAYLECASVTDPMARWELYRAARASALITSAATAEADASMDGDTPWSQVILGAAGTVLLWAFVAWALAPYAVMVLAWLCGVLA